MKEKIPNAKCEICKKEFCAKPSNLKLGYGKYCSRECQNENQKTGKFVTCSYCGKKIYKSLTSLRRKSKTNAYFCNKSCHCAWKNKKRKGKKKFKLLKKIWGSWCNSSTRVCGTLRADANSVDPPLSFLKFLKLKKKKTKLTFFKRPSKRTLHNLYWKENHSQTAIAKIFNATHTSIKRWFIYYKIPVKLRTLSCGRNPNSLKNLELGKTEEAERKSAESRTIYSKEELIEKIKEFVQKEGRIPTKNEFAKSSSYPNHTTCRDYFGTWNNAIKAAGYEPNERWFVPRNLCAKDGHLCNSISEIIIDDWLFKNKICHNREYLYPEGRYRCDFILGDIFIEFFGLADTPIMAPNYSAIMEKKRKLCKQYNIPLIELFKKDLYNLDQTLGGKLEEIKRKGSIREYLLSKLQIKLF